MNEKKMTRIPVYINLGTKKEIEQLKFDIWNESGRNVALSQLIRDLIEDQLVNAKEEILRKYSKENQ